MKKQKKFGRKLTLNKETITILNGSVTGKVVGGIPIPTLPQTVCCRPGQQVVSEDYDC